MGVIKPPMSAQDVLGAVVDAVSTSRPTLQPHTKVSTLTIEWNNFSSLRSRLCGQCNPQATATVKSIAAARTDGAKSQYLTETHPQLTTSTLQAIPTPRKDASEEFRVNPTSFAKDLATSPPAIPVISAARFEAGGKGARAAAIQNTKRHIPVSHSYPYASDPRWAPSGFITSSITKRHDPVDATTATALPTALAPPIRSSSTPMGAMHVLISFILAIVFLFTLAAYLIAVRTKITHTNRRAQHPPSFSRIVRDSLKALLSKPQPPKKKRGFVGKDKDVEVHGGDQLHHGYVVVSSPDNPYSSTTSPLSMSGTFGSSTALSTPHSAHRRRFPRTPSASSVDYLHESPCSGTQTPRSARVEIQDEESLIEKTEQGLEIGKRGYRAAKGIIESFKEEQMDLRRIKDGCMAVPNDMDERPLLPI